MGTKGGKGEEEPRRSENMAQARLEHSVFCSKGVSSPGLQTAGKTVKVKR